MTRPQKKAGYGYEYITDQTAADQAIDAATKATRYAIDTEFHRERTYYPQLALVQLAWDEECVLLDPLELDLTGFADLFRSDSLCILHAGIQDVEVLELTCKEIPRRLFDTQIAAGFLGYSTASLASLLDKFLDVSLAKGDRLTDWLKRPLTSDQLDYAAADVDNLIALADQLEEDLDALGRVPWALAESSLLSDRVTRRKPHEAINKIREARSLKGKSLQVAARIACWRETRAAEMNVPCRQILSDMGVVSVAQARPSQSSDLRGLRGVDGRYLRGENEKRLLEVLGEGPASKTALPTPRKGNILPKHMRPVITLVTAWIAQVARNNTIDPALLATRSDVEKLLKKEKSRLDAGWRADLVGEPIERLIAGNAAVAFDGGGRLVLEARTHQKIS